MLSMLVRLATAVTGLALCWPATAQTPAPYPSRTITVVVPFPAGGGVDAVARVMQDSMAANLGQPVVIENKPGAAGSTAMGGVARAAPDGYTLVFTNNPPLTQNMHLQRSVPFDTLKSFAPVGLVADSIIMLVINAKVPARSVTDLVALARERAATKPLNYGSAGPGSTYHVAGELLKAAAKVDIAHVPYRGTAPLVQDLIAGAIEIGWGTPTAIMPLVESGQLRVLALAEERRHPEFPDLPTIKETLPGVVTYTWGGYLAPVGTPREIIDRLNAALRAALADNRVSDTLRKQGWYPAASTPEEMTKRMSAEIAHWAKALPAVGLKPQ
jgi:tripartite-type tricarboxylate transporter receptor subunit TctC